MQEIGAPPAAKDAGFGVTMGSGRYLPLRMSSVRPRPRSRFAVAVAFVTICVGALAADGKAIVCVADKSVTYGDDISAKLTHPKYFNSRQAWL